MMKLSVGELVKRLRSTFTQSSKSFLDRAQPSYGNILRNTKKSGAGDPDFVGYAKLDDGTAVRIEGVGKTNNSGDKLMPIRIFKIPITMYDDKGVAEVYDDDPWP
jgi:hypothetical protein